MTNPTVTQTKVSVSNIIATIAAIIAIVAFIFGVSNWSDIQQYFWRQRVVGTWQDESGIPISFTSEGTFNAGGFLPANGYYTFNDGNHITLKVSGILGGMGNQVFEVSFSGNTMWWRDQALGFEYTYTKLR